MSIDFSILNSIIDSIAIVDSDANIIFMNQAWQQFSIENQGNIINAGVEINYLDVCKTSDVIGVEYAKEASKGLAAVINRKLSLFEMEYPCHSPQQERWFIMRASPVSDHDNLTIVSHINITERKISEERIEKKNQQQAIINERLQTAIYRVAHDIQSPLNSLAGLLDLTRIEGPNEDIEPYLKMMEDSVLNLKDYIQETIKLSSTTYTIEAIKFNSILSSFVRSVQYAEELKAVKLEIEIVQETDFFSIKSELASILSNLIGNGLKYYDLKKENSYIKVEIRVNEFEAFISISDNGIGMSTNTSSRIFALNYQKDKENSSGSGLGLYLVKKSVELLKGSIEVSSELNLGTNFKLLLPNLKAL